MSFWKKIKEIIGADQEAATAEVEALPPPERPADDEETEFLRALAEPSASLEPEAISSAVEGLRQRGRELRAVELLSRALRARPDEVELEAALALLHVTRLDFTAAAPLLEKLTHSDSYAQQAELALGEKAEREGDPVEALRRYERVLARDVTHSQALNRARRLREKLGSSAPAAAQATVVQPEGVATSGRYQLIRELGRGGAAAVYLALDRHLDRQVALKVYHPKTMQEDGPTQLAREGALPARVGHSGIVQVLDVDAELGAVILELITGGSLKERLAQGAATVDEALAVVEAVCHPLSALHRRGIVHRDVKPGNILLRAGDLARPVLTDLGVALLPGEAHEPGVGTPAFMAPEQRTQTVIDARADVYAVGVMLAAMLGGYPGPGGLVGALLDQCLSDNPGGRPRDAAELGRLIAALRFNVARETELQRDIDEVTRLAQASSSSPTA